jgi:Primase X
MQCGGNLFTAVQTFIPVIFMVDSSSIDIEEGLDYLLYLFKAAGQLQLFERTISTRAIGGIQKAVGSREEALAYFAASEYKDCRISCYPRYVEYQGIQRHPPNFLFVADLDRKQFKSEDLFNKTYNKILKNVAEVLNGANPAVIWSGNGYHLLLPVEISEPLETESAFLKYTEHPSRDFLRFAEQCLSMGKSDEQHYSMVSFKTYLTRVPGSLNSKCLNGGMSEEDSQVKLIQKWNGIKPAIKGSKLLREFYKYLADRHVKEKKGQYRHSKRLQRYNQQQQQWRGPDSADSSNNKYSSWFERLLQTPIGDCRKNAIDLILSRYLVNVRHLSAEDSYAIIKDWLDKCKSLTPLEKGFDYDYRIRFDLRNAIKSGRLPMSKEQLKEKLPTLYQILFSNN